MSMTNREAVLGHLVEGIAIASFDKKCGKWGMKAIEARSTKQNHFDGVGDDNDEEC